MSGSDHNGSAAMARAIEAADPVELQPSLPLPDHQVSVAEDGALVVKRGPGRRPGSRNKRDQALVDYLVKNYSHPLEGAVQIASTATDVLARLWQCSIIEAARVQASYVNMALPYLAMKQPQAVELTDTKQVVIVMSDGSDDAVQAGQAGEEDHGLVLEGELAEGEENQ